MAERIFNSGELNGVNEVDGLVSTGLTGVGFNGKNVRGKVVLKTVSLQIISIGLSPQLQQLCKIPFVIVR